MAGNPRVFTNLTTAQLAALTVISVKEDRSLSWLVSKAITDHIDTVQPYEGDADEKVMARTSPANVAKLAKCEANKRWRYINACVQRLIDERNNAA